MKSKHTKSLVGAFLGVLISLGVSGCGAQEEEDVEFVGGSCAATEASEIAIGVPVGANFNVNDVNMTGNITTSTCSGIPLGAYPGFLVDGVRAGNSLVLTDPDGNTLSFTLSGTTLLPLTDSGVISGCSISAVYAGTLDTILDKVNLTVTYSATELSLNACAGLL